MEASVCSKHFIKQVIQRQLLPLLVLSVVVSACTKNPGSGPGPGKGGGMYAEPLPNNNNVPPLSGMLDHNKIVMTSIISVDLNRDVARIPLHKGYYNNQAV